MSCIPLLFLWDTGADGGTGWEIFGDGTATIVTDWISILIQQLPPVLVSGHLLRAGNVDKDDRFTMRPEV